MKEQPESVCFRMKLAQLARHPDVRVWLPLMQTMRCFAKASPVG